MELCVVRWSVVDNLMISFVSPGEVTEREFDAWMREFMTKPFTRYLATSVGYINLNSVQRKRIADAMKKKAAKTAILTDETLIRGVVTALSWMGADIKAFRWDQVRESLHHLEISPEAEELAVEAIAQLKATAPSASSPVP